MFDERDAAADAPEVVVVDQAWADRFFPGGDAVKYSGLDQPDQGTVYWPMVQRATNAHELPLRVW